MTISRQIKTLYCNTSNTCLVNDAGAKANDPVINYKSDMILRFNVWDSSRVGVDLTGATFYLRISENYNSTPLISLNNDKFDLADWSASNIVTGKICCHLNTDIAAIGTYLDLVEKKSAHGSLWCTIDSIDYLLAKFNVTLRNIIY